MGRVNVCVKRSYYTATSVVVITSALMLAGTLFSHGYMLQGEEIDEVLGSIYVMYFFSITTMLLGIIGMYGACKEKRWVLTVFAVGMIPCILLIAFGLIQALVAWPKEAKHMEERFLNMLPLRNSSDSFINVLDKMQTELQCCGLQGYMDWNNSISDSCLCTKDSIKPCVAAPKESNLFKDGDPPVMIYSEACLKYILANVLAALRVTMGILWGITLLKTLSVALCIAILCQLRQKEDTPAVVYSAQAKSGNYSVLADAAELT